MYSAFNLRLESNDDWIFGDTAIKTFESSFNSHKKILTQNVENHINNGGVLDAQTLRRNFFPNKIFDAFISHAHQDKDLALGLTGWLYERFGLTSFVDSVAWNHADQLLKLIDNKYCQNYTGSYSYSKRNKSTAHIYMLLSTSLYAMMDNCECLIFINTHNSVKSNSLIENNSVTNSPWLFAELYMSDIIRRKDKNYHRQLLTISEESMAFDKALPLEVNYLAPLSHLTKINIESLETWAEIYVSKLKRNLEVSSMKKHPLDSLYILSGFEK